MEGNLHINYLAGIEGYQLNISCNKAMDEIAARSLPARKMFQESNSGRQAGEDFRGFHSRPSLFALQSVVRLLLFPSSLMRFLPDSVDQSLSQSVIITCFQTFGKA